VQFKTFIAPGPNSGAGHLEKPFDLTAMFFSCSISANQFRRWSLIQVLYLEKGYLMMTCAIGARFVQLRISIRLAILLAANVLGTLLPFPSNAQEADWTVHPAMQDMWTLRVGAFQPKADTTARLDGAGGMIGTKINLEDDLGLSDRDTLGSALLSVRLANRWRIEAEYFSLDRSNTKAIDRTIEWGDISFPVNTVVNGSFDSTIYRLSGGYSIIKDNKSELGVALGLFATDFSATLASSGIGSQTGDVLVPLPTIGIYAAYALSPRWLVSGRVDYFGIKYGDYDGSLLNATIGLDYRFFRNFAVGVGYRHVEYNLSVTKPKFDGELNYNLSGPIAYIEASF
jgi:hypothetical protein